MISKELFVKLITSAERFSAEIDRWNDFGIDLFDNAITILPHIAHTFLVFFAIFV